MVNKETTKRETEMESEREFQARVEAVERRALAKGKRLAAKADIGGEFTVRKNKNTKVSGTIESVEVSGVTWRGRSCYALFAVTLVCGTSEIRRTYNVKRIPYFA